MGPLGVAGVISGQNGVTVNANGIAYLTAANTYTGATTIAQSAWLGVGGPGSIAASSNVAVDGTLDVFHSSNAQSICSLSGSGSVVFGSTTLVRRPRPDLLGGIYNTYAAGSVSDTYPVPSTSPLGYGGVIVSGGLETFSGDNGYAGQTGIGEAGGLILSGTLRTAPSSTPDISRTTASCARRRCRPERSAASAISPAASTPPPASSLPASRLGTPGSLTVGTAFGLGSDATYLVRSAGAVASRIDVEGQASIPGLDPRRDLRHALATGPRRAELHGAHRLGRHSGPVRRFRPQYGNAAVAISLPQREFRLCRGRRHARSHAQQHPLHRRRAVGQRIRRGRGPRHRRDPWLPASLAAASLNFATAPSAFDALAGDLHSSLRTSLVENAYDLGAAALARLDAAECGWSAPGQVVSYGEGQPAANDGACRTGRRTAWIQAYNAWSHNGGANGISGLNGASGGFIGGVDAPAPGDWRIGGLLAYVHSGFSAVSTAASGSADNVSVGAYAGRLWGPLGLKVGGAYTWNSVSTNRTIAFPGFWDQAASSTNGGAAQGFADLSYRLDASGIFGRALRQSRLCRSGHAGFHRNRLRRRRAAWRFPCKWA